MGWRKDSEVPTGFYWEYTIIGDLPSENPSQDITVEKVTDGIVLSCSRACSSGHLTMYLNGRPGHKVTFSLKIYSRLAEKITMLDFTFATLVDIAELRQILSLEGKYSSELYPSFIREDDCLTVFCHSVLSIPISLLLNTGFVEQVQEFLNRVESLNPKEEN